MRHRPGRFQVPLLDIAGKERHHVIHAVARACADAVDDGVVGVDRPVGVPVALVGGMPPPSTSSERFMPCLRRSTGDGPATSPPPGALVMQPSTAMSSSSSSTMRS
jgi:hypothetical protein